VLRAVGLVRTLNKPLKVLGGGDLSTPLFVVADAFTASARTKIEGAGGSVTVLEIPDRPREALGVMPTTDEAPSAAEATNNATVEPAEAEAAPATPARTRRARPAAAPEPQVEPDAAAAPAAEEAETEAAAPAGAAAEAEPVVEVEQPETESPSGESA
jgi:hypothetical protein